MWKVIWVQKFHLVGYSARKSAYNSETTINHRQKLVGLAIQPIFSSGGVREELDIFFAITILSY